MICYRNSVVLIRMQSKCGCQMIRQRRMLQNLVSSPNNGGRALTTQMTDAFPSSLPPAPTLLTGVEPKLQGTVDQTRLFVMTGLLLNGQALAGETPLWLELQLKCDLEVSCDSTGILASHWGRHAGFGRRAGLSQNQRAPCSACHQGLSGRVLSKWECHRSCHQRALLPCR